MKRLSYEEIENNIRLLAKSNYYQTVYNYAKEMDIKLFKNNIDLTDLQILFLGYLVFYNNLYTDIAMGDVTEIVVDNFIYEDAFSAYKRKSKPKYDNKFVDRKVNEVNKDSWVFKSRVIGKK